MSKQSEEQQHSSQASAEMYSLSSILSDYKAGAFVRNEKKLSKKELEHKAEEIIAEMRREQNGTEEKPDTEVSAAADNAESETVAEKAEEPAKQAETEAKTEPDAEPGSESVPNPEQDTEAADPTGEPILLDPEYGTHSALPELKPLKTRWLQRQEKKRQRAISRYEKKRAAIAEETAEEEEETVVSEQSGETEEPDMPESEQTQAVTEETPQEAEPASPEEPKQKEKQKKPEPTREEAMANTVNKLKSLRRRIPFAFILCILMAILTMFSESSSMNVSTGNGISLFPVILVVLHLGVILLGLDVMAKGITDMISLHPGHETLTVVANLAAVADAALFAAGKFRGGSVSYSVCASAVLTFALVGSRMRTSAYRDTLKTMGLASVPTVVTAEDGLIEGGTVLTKRLNGSKGFIRRLLKTDMPDRIYHRIMPYVLVLMLVLSAAAAYLSGTGAFLHTLAALCCAAAGLAASMVFARPFAALARKLNNNGAAVAGWSGAMEMERAQGIIIRDLDMFPENCIYQNAMRVLSGALAERVVAYTGSVIIAAGSGLKRAFGELMRQYNAPLYHVEDFECGTEGGISAFIGQEQVLVGSSAYMNLLGIRVPSSVDMAGAVYTAIDNELCGVFVIQYTPSAMVQNALMRLSDGNLRPIFAIRDFNINPAMIQQKFRIDSSISFLPAENRYLLSREVETTHAPVALLSRDGLWHFSETARGSRRMVHMVRRALAMTLLGAVLGVTIIFIALSKGAFEAAAPMKLLSSMLLWSFATMLIGDCAEGK